MKNNMQGEGYRKIFFFRNFNQKRLGTQKFDCKNRVPKRSNQTFP